MQCSHCSREVQETRHTQRGYLVDYYLLHTGDTEWAVLKSPREDAPSIRYLRLTQPVDIVTCTACYGLPQIRKVLEADFNCLGPTLGKQPAVGPEENRVAGRDYG